MKKYIQRCLTLFLICSALLGTAFSVKAADSTVTWQGQEKGFGFASGSEYTSTDLFDSFKDVMPGDVRTQKITVQNLAADSDHVRIYLRAAAHGSDNQPLTDMTQEFLSKLSMRVFTESSLIYDSTADQTAGLTENVFLAQLSQNERVTLRVELEVPLTLDNQYAGKIGEVDWIFTAEQFGEDKTEDQPQDKEESNPENKPIINLGTLIQTGQLNWPIPVLLGAGIFLLILGLFLLFGKRKTNRE